MGGTTTSSKVRVYGKGN